MLKRPTFKKLCRYGLHGFILTHLFIMTLGSLPDKGLFTEFFYKRITGPYQNFLGLTQNWNMFAPNPGSTNSLVDAEIEFSDGSKTRWAFPRPSEMSTLEKYIAGEKYRKFFQEKLLPHKNRLVWEDLSKYLIREIAKVPEFKDRQIVEIQFYRHTSVVKAPHLEFKPHGQMTTTYLKEPTYRYKIQMEEFYEAANHH